MRTLGERTKAVSLCYASDGGSREDGWKSLVRKTVGERYCESAEDASGDLKKCRGGGNSESGVVAKLPGDTAGGGRQEQQPSKASRGVTGIHSATRGKFHTYAGCHDFIHSRTEREERRHRLTDHQLSGCWNQCREGCIVHGADED
jgi:hypothetical protein